MQSIVQTIRLDLKDFIKLSPQVKFLLIFQLIILFILSLLIGIIFSPKFKTNVENQAGLPVIEESVEDVQNSLSIVPETQTMLVGSTQTVQITYTGDPATAVDTVIHYIPSVFTVSNMQSGEAYDTILRRKIIDDHIYFSGAQSPFQEGADEINLSDYTVMTFDVTAERPTESARISFSEEDTVVASSGKNILGQANDVTIRVIPRPHDESP